MIEDEEIVRTIQDYCKNQVFERMTQGSSSVDVYRDSWRRFALEQERIELKEERLSRFTHKQIQMEVQRRFGTNDVDSEKKVGGASNLSFDLWNRTERTAFEICLGAIKNEFEKDILKGILDKDTTKLVILYREYGTGTQGKIYGYKWFEHPAQKEIIDRAGIFKLKVQPIPLID